MNYSRWLLWLLLGGLAAAQTWRYLAEAIYYGEYLHWSGEQSARLLIVTLAVTPLRRIFPGARWTAWLVARRRDLGLATFLYAALHAVAYLARSADLGDILAEAVEIGMAVGWVALVLFLALAATSNDASVRRLGRRWKGLHRWIYAAALLTFLHWVATAFDPTAGYVHLGVLLVVLALRAWPRRAVGRTSRPA